MPYTPVATDVVEPVDGEKASSAALEFRTLKAYIQASIMLNPVFGGTVGGDNFRVGNGDPAGGGTYGWFDTNGPGIQMFGNGNASMTARDTIRFRNHLGELGATSNVDNSFNWSAAINVIKASVGGSSLKPGDGTHTGYLAIFNPDGSRKAYLASSAPGVGNPIVFSSDDAATWLFGQALFAPNIGTNAFGARTVSAALPSGGADGDVWFQT